MERISEYEQFRKPGSASSSSVASKLKLKSGLDAKLESKLLPPFPKQPLPKLPNEYEQFRRPASNRGPPKSQTEASPTSQTNGVGATTFVRNAPSEYSQV